MENDIDIETIKEMKKLLKHLKGVKECMENVGWTDPHSTSDETLKYYYDTIEMIESMPYEIQAKEEEGGEKTKNKRLKA